MDKRAGFILKAGVVAVSFAAVLPLARGYAAEASNVSAGKTASAKPTPSTPNKTPATFDEWVAASKKVVERALSSNKGQEPAGTTPKVTKPAEKYIFKYPPQPVITEEMQPVQKTIEGEVGTVIKMGMNVTFEHNAAAASSRDLWIDFTQGIELNGVKNYSEFQNGDRVKVSYVEAKDGSKRAIESITLLKRKTEEERKREEEEDAKFEAAYAKKEAAAAKSSMEGGA